MKKLLEKRKKLKEKYKKGFTLIELLAVIVILAIILIIAVPTVLNSVATAKKKSLANVATIFKDEIKEYYDSKELVSAGVMEGNEALTTLCGEGDVNCPVNEPIFLDSATIESFNYKEEDIDSSVSYFTIDTNKKICMYLYPTSGGKLDSGDGLGKTVCSDGSVSEYKPNIYIVKSGSAFKKAIDNIKKDSDIFSIIKIASNIDISSTYTIEGTELNNKAIKIVSVDSYYLKGSFNLKNGKFFLEDFQLRGIGLGFNKPNLIINNGVNIVISGKTKIGGADYGIKSICGNILINDGEILGYEYGLYLDSSTDESCTKNIVTAKNGLITPSNTHGVYISGPKDEFNLYGGNIGSIDIDESVGVGQGVLIKDGTFNMYGGNINAYQMTNNGADGVYFLDNSTGKFNMYGGSINSKYYGVNFYCPSCGTSTFNFYKGNIKADKKNIYSIYSSSPQTIYFNNCSNTDLTNTYKNITITSETCS